MVAVAAAAQQRSMCTSLCSCVGAGHPRPGWSLPRGPRAAKGDDAQSSGDSEQDVRMV